MRRCLSTRCVAGQLMPVCGGTYQGGQGQFRAWNVLDKMKYPTGKPNQGCGEGGTSQSRLREFPSGDRRAGIRLGSSPGRILLVPAASRPTRNLLPPDCQLDHPSPALPRRLWAFKIRAFRSFPEVLTKFQGSRLAVNTIGKAKLRNQSPEYL